MTASDGRGQRLTRRGMSSGCTRRFDAGLWALQQRWCCTHILAPLAPIGAKVSHDFKASIRAILLGR